LFELGGPITEMVPAFVIAACTCEKWAELPLLHLVENPQDGY
jgi:hypothetical protein